MKIFSEHIFLTENVAVVESCDSNSMQPTAIAADDFFNFTGNVNETVELGVVQAYEPHEKPQAIRKLFGSWIEASDEDTQLKELYESRLSLSTLPVE